MTSPNEEAPTRRQGEGFDRVSYPTTQPHDTGSPRPKHATAYMPGSQIDRVLQSLLRGWICGSQFLEEKKIPRYSSRLSELRRDAWIIEKRRCQHPWHHHKTVQWQWRIGHAPPRDGQLFGDG